jgi:hypothetical protein
VADHSAAVSTHERNPPSAVLRTILAVTIVAGFPLLNGVLLAVIEALKPFVAFVPGWAFLGLNGILLAVTALAAVVTRVLAVPGVNEWLRKYRLLRWFTPEDAS